MKTYRIFLLMGMFLFVLQGSARRDLLSKTLAQEKAKDEPEVISLLGKKLYATPARGEELARLEKELEEARRKVEMNPDDPEHLILYGRRLASLWRYHEAIEVFTKGIELHPDYAMLYRHRGHRHISIRQFDKAVDDLTRASQLNGLDFDIWYHLGLAHYLRGEFDQARVAYKNCLKVAADDDSKVAISNWLFITLRRLGRKDEAENVLDGIHEKMDVKENQSYYDLLLFYKGRKSEKDILAAADSTELDNATKGNGIGCWYLYQGQKEKALTYFEKIVEGKYWPAFGFIAAEAEIARLR